jgi:hypothetical protein
VLGALAVLAVPLSIAASESSPRVTLLRGLYVAVPAALLLALLALLVSRRARVGAQWTVFAERRGPVRTARILAWLGIYAGVTAGIALAVYWLLRARH